MQMLTHPLLPRDNRLDHLFAISTRAFLCILVLFIPFILRIQGTPPVHQLGTQALAHAAKLTGRGTGASASSIRLARPELVQIEPQSVNGLLQHKVLLLLILKFSLRLARDGEFLLGG